MEAEGGKEGSGANDWDCGVAAGLGRGGAASSLGPFLNVYLPTYLTLFVHLALNCNCLIQM